MFRLEEPELQFEEPKLQLEENQFQVEEQQLAEAQRLGWDCSLVRDMVDLSGDRP